MANHTTPPKAKEPAGADTTFGASDWDAVTGATEEGKACSLQAPTRIAAPYPETLELPRRAAGAHDTPARIAPEQNTLLGKKV